jgi:hypothetical protein
MTRCYLCGRWIFWILPWVHCGEYPSRRGQTYRWHAAHLYRPLAGWRQASEEVVGFLTRDGLR